MFRFVKDSLRQLSSSLDLAQVQEGLYPKNKYPCLNSDYVWLWKFAALIIATILGEALFFAVERPEQKFINK